MYVLNKLFKLQYNTLERLIILVDILFIREELYTQLLNNSINVFSLNREKPSQTKWFSHDIMKTIRKGRLS